MIQKPLELRVIGLAKRLNELLDFVNMTLPTLSYETRVWSKFNKWSSQLQSIRSTVLEALDDLLPQLESILSLTFENREAFLTVLFQPSTRNLFLEIDTHFKEQGHYILSPEVMKHLSSLSDIAKIIALVGDAVIDMAVLHYLWSPLIDDVGVITQKRAEIVSNENMARLCDEWRLFEHRIHFDPPTATKSETDHIKGTLVEGVYGLIYIEHGLESVMSSLSHLYRGVNNTHPQN